MTLSAVNTQPAADNQTSVTVADIIYRLSGKDDYVSGLKFIQSRPLLRKVFERDCSEDGDTVEYWMYVYDECMTNEQREQADGMMNDARHKMERANSSSFYY